MEKSNIIIDSSNNDDELNKNVKKTKSTVFITMNDKKIENNKIYPLKRPSLDERPHLTKWYCTE